MASYIPPPLEIKSTMYKSCSLANRKPIDGFIGPCVNRQRVPNTLLLTKCSERRSLWKGRKPIEASQGASTVMVLVASSCLVTLPKSTAVTASWNGPSKPNVIVAELPDADIWKFPVPSFCLSFSRMAAKSALVFV